MNMICEFSVGFDNEIEEVSMYDEDIYTEGQMTDFINGLVRDHRIIVGERCEGSVNHDENTNTLKVEYRYCSELGEDYDSDMWETENMETTLP
jgi:hypothetical protein